MIGTRGSVFIGVAFSLISAVAAHAGGKDHGSSYATSGSDSGWYVRLDGSYGVHHDPDLVEDSSFELSDSAYDPAWSIGAGIGRYFTRSLRGDLTYDYRFETDVSGTASTARSGDGLREFGLTSHLLLANLYYDFNRHGRINPYIGIGLGAVYHETSEETHPTVCPCVSSITAEGDNFDFAGALMAGVALKLRERMNVDLGYRFLYLGEAETGQVRTSSPSGVNVISSGIEVEDLYAHEFRVGLRYNFNVASHVSMK